MEISVKEGATSSASAAFGDSYITPYIIAAGATPSQIAALTAIPNLFAPLSQLATPQLMEKQGRKKIVLKGVAAQLIIWLPITATIPLFLSGARFVPLLLISLWTIYALFGNLVAPAWNSWMGDIVTEERGKYFARRSAMCEAVLLCLTLITAIMLDFGKKKGLLFFMFGTFFLLAFITRLFSLRLLRRQYEPPLKLEKGYYFSFFSFVKRMRANNFGKFVLFRISFAAAVQLAAPFFAVYMLKELRLSYLFYIAIAIAMPLAVHIATWPAWGKFSDKYGNIRTLRICCALAALYPFLWLPSRNPYYLLFVPTVVSGIAWAGINLATANFIFDAVTPQRRSLCFAYFSVLVGIAVAIGATIGGWLVKLPLTFNIFLFLFALSGIARFATTALLLPEVKEVRPVADGRPLFQHSFRFAFFQKAERERQK